MNKPDAWTSIYCLIGNKKYHFECSITHSGGNAKLFNSEKLVAEAYAVSVDAALHAVCNYFEGAEYREALETVDWAFATDI